jgi:aminoglycoside phosphotransferase (APT) family kinase protein
MLAQRRRRWLHRTERKWTAEVAPTLVAGVAAVADTAWRTEAVVFTSTSVAIATVTRPGCEQRFIVKVPWSVESAERVRRHARVLTALRTDRRVDSLRPIMPRQVGQGSVGGHYYCVEQALAGVSASTMALRPAPRAALLRAAARLIGDLHARTHQQTLLDGATVEAWVDTPLRRIERFSRGRRSRNRLRDAVGRLRDELMTALVGRTVRTAWIHGDFWPGNLLMAPATAQVTGVVDWDCASAHQLPLHDLLHLHVLTRRLARGDELGDVVVHALRGGIDQALDVPAGEVASWLDGIPQRSAVLLYWLRHVLLFMDSEGHHDNPRWLRGNVEHVLGNV